MTPNKENVPGKCCVLNGVRFGGCGLSVTDIEAGQSLSSCIIVASSKAGRAQVIT